MGYTTKIATCCYCGARTALVLDKQRHELACASCGAPLHDMKSLPTEKAKPREKPKRHYPHHGHRNTYKDDHYAPPRPKKRKKRKSILRKVIEEAVDIIEDIID